MLARGEAVLVVDVAVVEPADGGDFAAVVGAVVADELGHRPRFERRADGPQVAGSGGSGRGPVRSCSPRSS